MSIEEINATTFGEFASKHVLKNFFQTKEYGELMSHSDFSVMYIGAYHKDILVAASLILYKTLSANIKYGYAPRGFLVDFYNTDLLKAFTRKVKEFFLRRGFAFIKINPEITYSVIDFDNKSKTINSKNKELKDLEIEVNRMDVKLDNLLSKLNETYSLTYESAKYNYHLDIDIEEAKAKVSDLKRIIKDLGIVNLGSIEEFDRVNERYEFLSNQKNDLDKAVETLLEIIKEMDNVMISSFKDTFEIIRANFKETFKELFKGGNADLKLTDPNNLLETGIEIVASPPGKSLRSISLLSGGEMTFTAISLLFAILKTRPVPFCILDEVEAALDEVNVDSFGEYLNKFKNKTQFILITHKKKTMEYADVLYGITMQESGVSKLVSVRLEEIK